MKMNRISSSMKSFSDTKLCRYNTAEDSVRGLIPLSLPLHYPSPPAPVPCLPHSSNFCHAAEGDPVHTSVTWSTEQQQRAQEQ